VRVHPAPLLTSCVALLVAPICTSGAHVLPRRIVLKVEDTIGSARTNETVCSGVPFARGALRADQPVHVEGPDGTALPTQANVLGRWADGSVKWLLVQFAAACPAGADRQYHLVRGQGPTPPESRRESS